MSTDDIIDEAFDAAQTLLESDPQGFSSLNPAMQTVVRVVSAQGVIDNGGFRYFFESDWPGQPPYSDFVEAYRAIGCDAAASELDRIAGMFPFDSPHQDSAARNAYMERHCDDATGEIRGWGDSLCGDKTIWEKLREFCHAHRDELGA